MEVLHFNSQKERLDYLRGGFEEIIPTEVVVPNKEEKPSMEVTEVSDGTSVSKPKKAKKGKKRDDAVQAE